MMDDASRVIHRDDKGNRVPGTRWNGAGEWERQTRSLFVGCLYRMLAWDCYTLYHYGYSANTLDRTANQMNRQNKTDRIE